jgi:hypothetical protein
VDQLLLFRELEKSLLDCLDEPIGILLERGAETGCQIFRFQRSTAALLDPKKDTFTRRVAIGYGSSHANGINDGTVPKPVIDHLFGERYRIRMVYHEVRERSIADYLDAQRPERRTQSRRANGKWELGDVAVVRLTDEREETTGYFSFDKPEDGRIGGRDLFFNLELFGQWMSYAIAQHRRVSYLERRMKWMERLLVTSNIFKLNLNLRELFNEIVWSIKFSSEFNLVAIGLVSRKTSNLELQAVACNDKIKQNRLLELQFPPSQLMEVFRDEYHRGKSYLVTRPETAFKSFKMVYYGSSLSRSRPPGSWPAWGMLLVPIRTSDSKTIGLLIADDYTGRGMPSDDDIHILEIMSNQFGIAIDNRGLYMKTVRRLQALKRDQPEDDYDFYENPTLAIKRMAERIFRNS